MPMTASCSASTLPDQSRRSPLARWPPCAASSPDSRAAWPGYRESRGTGGIMRLRPDDPIEIKSPAELAIMREAGLVTAAALRAVADAVEPGISTAELDAVAEREIRGAGAVPSFKGYFGFPATICTSVNEQIVHGIPSEQQVLHDGDVLSIDCGAIVRGWHGDSALTVRVGPPGPSGRHTADELAGL